ncbi:MAG: protein translocase subunit SecD [Patescibacteria group bacterium]
MNVRLRLWLVFVGIILLTVGAAVIAHPRGPDIKIGGFQRESRIRLGLDLQGGAHLVYNADTSKVPNGEERSAVEGVRDVIERRVNAFGVSEPVVQTNLSGKQWRMIVELPGVTDVDAAIAQIGETPLLEFKKEKLFVPYTDEEKKAIQERNEEKKRKSEDVLKKVLSDPASFEAIAKEQSEDPGSKEKGGDLDFFGKGVMDPAFEKAVFEGEIGKVMPDLVKSSFGYHIIKVVEERAKPSDPEAEKTTNDSAEKRDEKERRASHILFQLEPEEKPQSYFPDYENTSLSGKNLKRAGVEFDQSSGIPNVSLEFDDEGKKLFEELTGENIGKTIAIYLDGQIVTAPKVQQRISGGQAVITGDFALDEARDMARRLNAGALPVAITLVNQQQVGATLGQTSVERSLFAGLFGILIVAFFVIGYYRLSGLIATLALGVYALLTLAIFKLWPVTLTLAGVAGFILSIGMAVDANVLIFERMKEELRAGKPLRSAIEDGFSRAWLSIRDSNFSSLITCFILAWFGTSLIQGFAITLGIGIMVSMFTAITVSRTLLRLLTPEHLSKRGLKFFGLRG